MQIIVVIIAVGSCVAATVLIGIANATFSRMIEEIDAGSGPAEKLGRNFFVEWNVAEVLKRHRILFPLSPKRRRATMSTFGGFLFLIVSYVMIQILVSGPPR